MAKSSDRKPYVFSTASKTQQGAAEGLSVGDIVSRHRGVPSGFGLPAPRFGEWKAPDYHRSFNLVMSVDREFARLPARIRGQFNNQPALLLEFVNNSDNRMEAVRLGLVVPTEKEAEILHAENFKRTRARQLDLVDESDRERVRAQRLRDAENDLPLRPDPEAQVRRTPREGD